MADALNHLLFGWYPYLALTVFLLGSAIRFDREQYGWRSGSSQLLRRKQLLWGSNLFHVGILFILMGHTVGLLTPLAVFEAFGVPHEAKQLLAMSAGGVAGLMVLVGLALLLHRRLTDPRILATSSRSDIVVLVLLLAQVSLGLLTIPVSAQHLDGEEMVKLMNWAQGVFILRPDNWRIVEDVNPIFKIHLTLGMTIFLIFPFTRLVHIWSAPVWYLGRQGYQVVRTRKNLGPAE